MHDLTHQHVDRVAPASGLAPNLVRRLGVVPSYYLHYFWDHDDLVEHARTHESRAEEGAVAVRDRPSRAQLDGVDLVSGSDPIYVDLTVNGVHSGFSIYFTGAQSSLLLTSQYDPVAFTSP